MSPQYRYYQRGRYGGGSGLFPPVIKGLLIANLVVFIIQNFFSVYSVGDYSLGGFLFKYGALFPVGSGNFFPWQLFSYQFLHGGFMHIFFNMFMLWMFGVELENNWGGRKFLIFYLLSGVGAGLTQLFISPMFSGVGPTVGASGSIYGVFVAFAMSFPNRSIMIFPFFIPIKAKYLIILLVGMDLLMGITTVSAVAHLAHIGGAAAGWFLFKFGEQLGIYRFINKLFSSKEGTSTGGVGGGNFYEQQQSQQRSQESGPKIFKSDWFKKKDDDERVEPSERKTSKFHVNGEEIDQAKIDEILDKISESGYQSLTEREKEILFELSQKLK